MEHHPQNRKRQSRLRIGKHVITLPNDLHPRLSKQAEIGRYESMRSCMYRALDLGLSVMEVLNDRSHTIVNRVVDIVNNPTQA